jgi:hypothetical protein
MRSSSMLATPSSRPKTLASPWKFCQLPSLRGCQCSMRHSPVRKSKSPGRPGVGVAGGAGIGSICGADEPPPRAAPVAPARAASVVG